MTYLYVPPMPFGRHRREPFLTLSIPQRGKESGDRETEGKSPSLPLWGIESERVNKGA